MEVNFNGWAASRVDDLQQIYVLAERWHEIVYTDGKLWLTSRPTIPVMLAMDRA